jgi:N utilization substance protein B
MSRKTTRINAFKLIFQIDFFSKELYECLFENYFRYSFFGVHEKEIIYKEFFGITNNLDRIDSVINKYSKWSISRLNKVDLALLRLAIYEMFFEDNFCVVVISEVVDIADRYGTDTSCNFINGILAELYKAFDVVSKNLLV